MSELNCQNIRLWENYFRQMVHNGGSGLKSFQHTHLLNVQSEEFCFWADFLTLVRPRIGGRQTA